MVNSNTTSDTIAEFAIDKTMETDKLGAWPQIEVIKGGSGHVEMMKTSVGQTCVDLGVVEEGKAGHVVEEVSRKKHKDSRFCCPNVLAFNQEDGLDGYKSGFFSVLGLTASLVVYSLLQERIMTIPFGGNGARFRHSLFLVLCNRLVACVTALIVIRVTGSPIQPVAPMGAYGIVSVANVMSSTCQYEALKYVSFPVQVLAKCIKMIPVMLWQGIIKRKVYTRQDYLQAGAVSAGCGIFLFSGEVASSVGAGKSETWVLYVTGGTLLLIYLVVDGFTSTWQDHLFTGYQMDLANQVLYTTACSIVLSTLGLVGTGKLWPALRFMWFYPEAWYWVLGISFASAAVQFFVSHTIKVYGALVFATVMTTRQWLSILLSCAVFMHPLSLGQW